MWSIPNLLSTARILFVPLFVILLMDGSYGWAFVVFILGSVSDAIDGLMARLLNQRTVLGSYLDPAADKLLSASAFIILSVLNVLPSWLTVIVISRDVIICLGIMILFWTAHPLKIQPSVASKITTALQLTTVASALYYTYDPPATAILSFLIWGTAVATVISGLQYIGQGIKMFGQSP